MADDPHPIVFANTPLFVPAPDVGPVWLRGELTPLDDGRAVITVPDGALLAPVLNPDATSWTAGPAEVSCQPDGRLEPRPVGTRGAYEIAAVPDSQAEVVYGTDGTLYVLPIVVLLW
jgi:hypothetical protein